MKLFLKSLSLIGSFILVIYGMQKLKSEEFINASQSNGGAFAILMGTSERPMNWCPKDVIGIQLLDSKGDSILEFKDPKQISLYCEIMIGGVTQEQLRAAKFAPRLKAYSATNEEVYLESSEVSGVFNVRGLPFASSMLKKILQRSI